MENEKKIKFAFIVTEKGIEAIKFKDGFDTECCVTSSFGENTIWIGTKDGKMNLNKLMAQKIVKILSYWVRLNKMIDPDNLRTESKIYFEGEIDSLVESIQKETCEECLGNVYIKELIPKYCQYLKHDDGDYLCNNPEELNPSNCRDSKCPAITQKLHDSEMGNFESILKCVWDNSSTAKSATADEADKDLYCHIFKSFDYDNCKYRKDGLCYSKTVCKKCKSNNLEREYPKITSWIAWKCKSCGYRWMYDAEYRKTEDSESGNGVTEHRFQKNEPKLDGAVQAASTRKSEPDPDLKAIALNEKALTVSLNTLYDSITKYRSKVEKLKHSIDSHIKQHDLDEKKIVELQHGIIHGCNIIDSLRLQIKEAIKKITPEQLHLWYLECIKSLTPEAYNKEANKPYHELTVKQQQIDIYIASKIKKELEKET